MVSAWGAGDAAVVETEPEELPPGDTESVGVTAASVVLTGPEETGELPEEEPAEVPEDAGLTEEVPDEPGLFSGSAAAVSVAEAFVVSAAAVVSFALVVSAALVVSFALVVSAAFVVSFALVVSAAVVSRAFVVSAALVVSLAEEPLLPEEELLPEELPEELLPEEELPEEELPEELPELPEEELLPELPEEEELPELLPELSPSPEEDLLSPELPMLVRFSIRKEPSFPFMSLIWISRLSESVWKRADMFSSESSIGMMVVPSLSSA